MLFRRRASTANWLDSIRSLAEKVARPVEVVAFQRIQDSCGAGHQVSPIHATGDRRDYIARCAAVFLQPTMTGLASPWQPSNVAGQWRRAERGRYETGTESRRPLHPPR